MKLFYITTYFQSSRIILKPLAFSAIAMLIVTGTAFGQKIKEEKEFVKKSLKPANEKSGPLANRSFQHPESVQSFLPGTLVNWTVKLEKNKVVLAWTTTIEKNSLHFTIEKSFNGIDYIDAAVLFAAGNSDIRKQYGFSEKLSQNASKNIYYRLKMVDLDANIKYSDVRIVRGTSIEEVKLEVYPNPTANDLKVTVAASWVNQKLLVELYNINGILVKTKTNEKAKETELLNVSDLPKGMYVVKVSNGSSSSVQRFLKN